MKTSLSRRFMTSWSAGLSCALSMAAATAPWCMVKHMAVEAQP